MDTISVYVDGDKWCVLLGENLQDGLVGFGNTPQEALRNLVDEIDQYGWNWDF